jgi:8-oxo-dGTP pyrophosphatase MutT (NUDIX family)
MRPLTGVTLPTWWHPLAAAAASVPAEQVSRLPLPAEGGRASAVLILLAEGPELLLIERASTLRSHAGQPAFPGGATEPGESAEQAALREAHEEVGLDPETVEVVTALPDLWLPVSGFVVTPVLGWWRSPHAVGVADHREVARVERVPVAVLADPAHRVQVRHPSGYIGPAFRVHDMLVWGFTGGLVATLLDLGGWAVPWDSSRVEELPAEAVRRATRTVSDDAPR